MPWICLAVSKNVVLPIPICSKFKRASIDVSRISSRPKRTETASPNPQQGIEVSQARGFVFSDGLPGLVDVGLVRDWRTRRRGAARDPCSYRILRFLLR